MEEVAYGVARSFADASLLIRDNQLHLALDHGGLNSGDQANIGFLLSTSLKSDLTKLRP